MAGSEDSREVIRIRDISPDVQIVDISQVGRAWDSRRTVSKGGSDKRMPLSVFAFRPRLRVAGLWMMLRDYRPPIRPRWSERLISRRWDGWRPSNALCLRCQASCPLDLLGWLPLRIWGTLRYHCPLIVFRRGDHRRFWRMAVCLTCHQFRQDF